MDFRRDEDKSHTTYVATPHLSPPSIQIRLARCIGIDDEVIPDPPDESSHPSGE